MYYKVTQIEFDFTDDTDDNELDYEIQEKIIFDVKYQIWDAEDDDDLVEKITDYTGWCINSIDFCEV